jgi:hypothetical protein
MIGVGLRRVSHVTCVPKQLSSANNFFNMLYISFLLQTDFSEEEILSA